MFLNRTEITDKINFFCRHGESFLFVIDFDAEKGFVFSPADAAKQGILYDFGNGENKQNKAVKKPFRFELLPVSPGLYTNAFSKVMFHLNRGDTYLLNLTFPTPLVTDATLEELFYLGNARYKIYVPGCFAVFSPELFVRIEGGKIFSCPMKGTIDASIPDAEQRLLADRKEFFEHNTIVDLIRNDLSMVSVNVQVNRFRYIERIRTNRGDLLQMSSEISGDLPVEFPGRLGEILFTLLPAGSVTGAPKKKTVEIIRSSENYSRGFYTGIFGFFNGHSLTSAVSIRYIEQTPGGLVFKSGGGITALSEEKSEYEEMLKKVYVPVV